MIEVSIVIPTKNNADILERCLKSIVRLDYPPEKREVIIVDGHSTDATVEIGRRYGCRVVLEDGGTIGYARQKGVEHARGTFIAFTDADCVVSQGWLSELLRHFTDDGVAAVGGPNITPQDDTSFAKCVGAVLSYLSKPGARYGLKGGEVMEVYHNPTCNVMYRRDVLEECGGFDCTLITVDDEELDWRIRRRGYRILYTPSAVVYHYRKPTWKKFMRMAYTYGVGRMQAIRRHPEMGRWFHFVPSALILFLLLTAGLSVLYSSSMLLLPCFTLVGGAAGIALMGAHIKRESECTSFITACLLIGVWFWLWGLGFIRGLVR